MTSTKIVQFPRPPTPLVQLHPKFFHPLDLGRPISNEPPWLYILVCAVAQKCHEMFSLKNVLILQSTCFICIT